MAVVSRDLHVHDRPALAAAVRQAERVVPLFLLDVLAAVHRPGVVSATVLRSRRRIEGTGSG